MAEHKEEHPVLQGIMDVAYDRHPKGDTPFFNVLSPRERKAVAICNLNYQVCNGGFHQWVSNGYCSKKAVEALHTLLNEIGTPEALQVEEMIGTVSKNVNLKATDKGFCGDYWINEMDEDELGPLDDDFYQINDELLDQAEKHFTKDESETSFTFANFCSFTLEREENETDEELRDRAENHAMEILAQIETSPVLHECSNEDMVD